MNRKNGFLFYTSADAQRNRWFIRQLCEYAEPEGLSLRLCLAEDGFPAGRIPEFVINRSRDAAISRYCEEVLSIPVFNSADVTEITNDKYLTHCFLRSHGLPTADTVSVQEDADAEGLKLPLVAKPADGHGGQGVICLRTDAELSRAVQTMQRPFLLQRMMQPGRDLRVYVLNGEIYAAVLRTSEQDFRSNYSLGGRAELYHPDAAVYELVQRVQAVLPLDFAGVDFLWTPDGQYVIGEIEDAVGCRMLYALSGLDPAADLIHMIAEKLAGAR